MLAEMHGLARPIFDQRGFSLPVHAEGLTNKLSLDLVYSLTTRSATFSVCNKWTTLVRMPGKSVREYMVSDL